MKTKSATGSGWNRLEESVSTKTNTIENQVTSSGSISTSLTSFGSAEGVIVDQNVNLAGDKGSIGIKSDLPKNEFIIAGGFSDKGSMDGAIGSSSGETANIDGIVSSAGADLLNNGISQALSSGELALKVEGISLSQDGAIGQFGLTAVNRARNQDRHHHRHHPVKPQSLHMID